MKDGGGTCGKLGQVTAASLAQATNMELTLALIAQDHGAITEGTQGKVRAATDVAPPCIVVQVVNHVPAAAQHSRFKH